MLLFCLLPSAPAFADGDYLGVAVLPLSSHPGTQRHMARYYDRKVKNGYGVMMDDVIAALYTATALTIMLVLVYMGSHL